MGQMQIYIYCGDHHNRLRLLITSVVGISVITLEGTISASLYKSAWPRSPIEMEALYLKLEYLFINENSDKLL